ncbi:hypothetical protein [Vagococcus sp.]|uniref:hypothetical protein n=1 Tax=Vagococcus sp. TaxID=1933889 RepID=UPI002FC81481
MGTVLTFFKWFLLITSIVSLNNFIKKSSNNSFTKQGNKNLLIIITLTIVVWFISFFITPTATVEHDNSISTSSTIEQVENKSDYLNDIENIEILINNAIEKKDLTIREIRPMQGDTSTSLDLIIYIDPEAVMKKSQINITVYDILSAIKDYDYSKYAEIKFYYRTGLIDNLGNSKDVIVGKVNFSKETLDKMNMENLTSLTIENAADKYWLHNAIDK